jgi:hypothetical protein
MNKKLLAVIAAVILIVVLAVVLTNGNFFSTNVPGEPTPTPATTSTPAPTATLVVYTMTIDYSETSRQDTGYDSIDVNMALQARTNDGNTRNMILDNFYVTVDGVEVKAISQTTGNFYVNPGYTADATLTIRLPSGTGTDYKLNYRDSSFSIEWIKTTPTPSPTPLYAVTVQYKETDRKILTANDVQDSNLVNCTFLKIAMTAQSNDGNIHGLVYENLYATVNGVEATPLQQLSGTWSFNQLSESETWMIFRTIGTNYELNYRDSSLTIEWVRQ